MINRIFKETKYGLEFSIYLTPGSQKEDVTGVFQDEFGNFSLKISVHTRPTNNNANESLVKLLSSSFKVAKSNISIKQGQKSRKKLILISVFFIKDIPPEIISLATSHIDAITKQLSLFN